MSKKPLPNSYKNYINYLPLSNDANESDNSETESQVARDLNNLEVINPIFDQNFIQEKFNSNNSNNACTSKPNGCGKNCPNHDRNSFLKIVTNSIRTAIDRSSSQADTVGIRMNKNHQIELKLVIPKDCFNQQDLNSLHLKKKCDTSSESDEISDSSEEENFKKSTSCKKSNSCILLLVLFSILMNPLFGFIALLAFIRSRKNKDEFESKRLMKTSRQTAFAGIVITLVVASVILILLLFKLEEFMNINNVTNETSTAMSHKLHFEITHLDDSMTSTTSSSRLIRENINSTKSFQENKTFFTITTSTALSTSKMPNSTAKLYDRLSFLIDHDLFEMLKLKYKINRNNFVFFSCHLATLNEKKNLNKLVLFTIFYQPNFNTLNFEKNITKIEYYISKNSTCQKIRIMQRDLIKYHSK
ncbi:hypothetical protein BpHYR1_030486, partial [Brachionus plicatilis]